jgi:hypothetical protein
MEYWVSKTAKRKRFFKHSNIRSSINPKVKSEQCNNIGKRYAKHLSLSHHSSIPALHYSGNFLMLCKECLDLAGRSIGVCHRIGNVFGPLGTTREIDPFDPGLHRPQFPLDLGQKTIIIGRNPQC